MKPIHWTHSLVSLLISLIFSTLFVGGAAWSASEQDDETPHTEEEIPQDIAPSCEVILTPATSAMSFYRHRLPDTGGYHFNKKQLDVLFNFKERAQADPEKLTMIETEAEKELVSFILKRPVKTSEIFSYQQITDKILMGAFYRLAYKFAKLRSASFPDFDMDDMVQVAMIGLHKTILVYDFRKGYMLSSWAFKTMWGELEDLYGTQLSSWELTSLPLAHIINTIRTRYLSETGRQPTAQEILEIYNARYKNPITLKRVVSMLEQRAISGATSAVGIVRSSAYNDFELDLYHEITLADLAIDESAETLEQIAERRLIRSRIADALWILPGRERRYLLTYYGLNLFKTDDGHWTINPRDDGRTLEQIAQSDNVSRERVRQVLAKAQRILKFYMVNNPYAG